MTVKIVLIGAGNVGYHLGRRLKEAGLQVVQIFSRQEAHARRLAKEIQVPFVTDLAQVVTDAELYILTVNDGAMNEVAAQLQVRNGLVVHTSGGTPSAILQPYFPRFGVLYPLQTFSLTRPIDFTPIPICVCANNTADEDFLFKLGSIISQNVYKINDNQRAVLHVAAVFVNNFTNYLFQIGYDILQQENLSFDLLRPLILETAAKIQSHAPAEMQTGPAVRGDAETVERHLAYLERFPGYRELYQIITKSLSKSRFL
jgi:predicted short-subunit dehydrogenase-like oxidoreductase (DUF2520 family)